MTAAKYNLTPHDFSQLNEKVFPELTLYQSPWTDSIWMYSSWKQVNLHLQKVTKFMAHSRGSYRMWSFVSIPPDTPHENPEMPFDNSTNLIKSFRPNGMDHILI